MLPSLGIVIVDDPESKRGNGSMSTVRAVPGRGTRETQIFRFLKDARCSVRMVGVRLFKTGRLSDRMPVDRRGWEPGSDLAKILKEISKYIADSGHAEATLVASDEV
jgi:hypothetical protein